MSFQSLIFVAVIIYLLYRDAEKAVHIRSLENRVRSIEQMDEKFDKDMDAAEASITEIEAEIAALKAQPSLSDEEQSRLDTLVARLQGDAPPPLGTTPGE